MTDHSALAALFDQYPTTAKGIAATYQILLGGVPTEGGFTYLIGKAISSNYGSNDSQAVFNDENIFINLTNNLVEGNGEAQARFEILSGGASSLAGRIEAFYRALVPVDAQSDEGLAFLTRPKALEFYAGVAAERGMTGDDGAAVVALASLLQILVRDDLDGIGDDVNDLVAAIHDGTAELGDGLANINDADGAAHDGDDGAPSVVIAIADADPLVNRPTTVTFDFSMPVQGFDLSDVEVAGGTLSNLQRSPDDPRVYTATFTPGARPGPASIAVTGPYQDLAGNDGADASLSLIVRSPEGGSPGDTPPTAVEDKATVAEDAVPTVIDVLANDTDPDGGPKSITDVTQGSNGGTVAITNGGADLSYTPAPDFFGTETFTYTLNGGSTATVTVTVTPVDDMPTAIADAATVAEDAVPTVIDVLANDVDPDGGPKSITAVSQGSNGGTVAITNGGADLSYTPAADFFGTETFTYTLNGGSTATVTVTVTPVDDMPTAIADAATVAEDAVPTVIDVLANDVDPDGGPKSITAVSQGSNGGTVAITNGGADLSYTPAPDFYGTETFTYTLNGGSTATVTVTVTPVDDMPTAIADAATVAEDAVPTVIDVLANDVDPDGGLKSITAVSQGSNGGTVAITNGGADLSYTPAADFFGAETFTYTLNGGSTATVTMTVTPVDDMPTAIADAATVAEDAVPTVIDVLANDVDPDGGPKSITAVSQGGNGGTIIISNGGANLTYTPAAGFAGTETFTYTLNGGSTATVTMTVTTVNHAPVSGPDAYAVDKNRLLTVDTAAGVLGNDTDADGDPTSAILVSGPANGMLSLNPDGSFSYQPNLNFFGTDSFTYKANDGLADGNVATVTITVNDVGSPAPSVISLASIAAGNGGFKIIGEAAGDWAGATVSAAGDVNGDGIDDFIVAAENNDAGGDDAGAAYVVFGSTTPPSAPINLGSLGTRGFKIIGEAAFDYAGRSVSPAGDINNDGIDDFIVGAYQNDAGGVDAGAAYVVFGSTTAPSAPINLGSLGTDGFKIIGEAAYDLAGHSVSSAGDVNGDGIDDLIVGAPSNSAGGSYAGAAYVVFGSTTAPSTPVNLGSLGTDGIRIISGSSLSYAGMSVSSAGDVNGDGIDDLIVGAPTNSNGSGFLVGAAYVIFGSTTPPSAVNLDQLGTGLTIIGEADFNFAGLSVSSAGDVDGDGFDDLIVGAYGNNSDTGAAYVIFGSATPPTAINLGQLGTAGFKIVGEAAGDQTGYSVSSAGDVNGDGFDDLIIGAYGIDAAYLVFGRATRPSEIDLTDIAAGIGGFKIVAENDFDFTGASVSSAGDVNGDGYDDLIVGAFGDNTGGSEAGAAYVIFGGNWVI